MYAAIKPCSGHIRQPVQLVALQLRAWLAEAKHTANRDRSVGITLLMGGDEGM